jgi:hypothetical protein
VRQPRLALLLLIASSAACASIVGFEDLRFDGVAVGGDGDAPDGPGIDGQVDASSITDGDPPADGNADVVSDATAFDADGAAKTRVREVTFEDGMLVGGATGTDKIIGGVTLVSPGLRGTFAAKFAGASASADLNLPAQPSELFVTFHLVVDTVNGGAPNDAQIIKISCGVANTVDLHIASDKMFLQVGLAVGAPSAAVAVASADLRIGVHVKLGSPGLAEVFVTSGAGAFGAPFGSIATNLGKTTKVSVGSAIGAGGRYDVTIDDILLDTAVLPIP